MKKTLLRVSALLLLSFQLATAFAQAPQKMSYQAVIRNSSNTLVTSSSVGMQISILQGSSTGTAVYVETQTATTNANGLVTIEIGNGTAITGTFSAIDWSAGPYFIMTETDPNGGSTYTIAGTTQLMSVPYALYAATSGNGAGATGATGATGADGMNGTNGIDGAMGGTGVTGADGMNGANGIDGAVGATGATGADGMNGTNGVDGIAGATGVTGATGSIGMPGMPGTNGTNGTNGATGATGATGTAGTNGSNGANGIDGAIGATGATGADGMNGTNGIDGIAGATGVTGATGTAGTNGSNGTNGIDGAMGSTGATGAMGPMGPMGMGMPGMNGTNGTNGATGTTGATGTAGTNGTNGTNGAIGSTGATGAMGPMGPMGMGMPGMNGTNGTNGATGATGATGTAGTNGTNGTNGSNGATGAVGVTGSTGATGVTGATGLADGTAAGNTTYWNGTAWVTNSSNIYNNGGNIGIGSTTPAYKLDIVEAGNTIFRAKSLAANSYASFILSNPERDFMLTNNALDDQLSFYYNGANRLQFNLTNQFFNSGNVGIGTITPNAALQLGNVITNRRIVLWEDANNDHQFYGFGINGNTLRYQVAAPSQNHIFYTGASTTTSTELMRIQGDGNVGIGTSAPSSKLEVAGKTKINGQLEVTTTTGAILLPRLTTTERTALTATPGMMIYNTSTGKFQGYATSLGAESLDQSMTIMNGQMNSSLVGQTFIAGVTGELSKIDVTVSAFTAAGSCTMRIYDGAGTTGTLLGSLGSTISAAGLKSFTFTGINVTAGNTYTISIVHSANCNWSIDNAASYPSGTFYTGLPMPAYDLWFKTYVKPTVNSWVDFH
jgi:hypothetical protein